MGHAPKTAKFELLRTGPLVGPGYAITIFADLLEESQRAVG